MLSMPTMAATTDVEQKFFDRVLDEREHKRVARGGAIEAAADNKARAALRRNAESDATLGNPDDPVAFLRIDTNQGDCYYVGRTGVSDQRNDRLVYAWKSELILKLRAATHDEPGDVTRHRKFQTRPLNQIESIDDVVLAELAERVASLVAGDVELLQEDTFLQQALGRERSTDMQQIVETIQAAQSSLIGAPADQLLIIQGGPGTGKTAVALHRVSSILYNNRESISPEDVLVVGPNPTFTRYISRVLPELGDERVHQTDIGKLMGASVSVGFKEPPEAARLKGDARMAELISKALIQRIAVPDATVSFSVSGVQWKVDLEVHALRALVEPLESDPYNVGRQRFRTALESLIATYARRRAKGDGARLRTSTNLVPVQAEIEAMAERVWPRLSPQAFLRDLFGSVERLLSAASGTLDAEEVSLLRRQAAPRMPDQQWSKEDLVLLDQASFEMAGDSQTYAHIVVDEAQDLSPMQLLALRRRSRTGAMTVVGDVAQSTGYWARDTWDDVIGHLASPLPRQTAQLEYGYRVPRSVMELAARLLPTSAPGIEAPTVVRDVDPGPQYSSPADGTRLGDAVLEVVQRHSAKGLFVGVVCPDGRRDDVEGAFREADIAWKDADQGGLGTAINVVSPVAAKGLEFDAVVVVDPQMIVDAGPQGERMLYIALTRTTRYLDVVHLAGELPSVLGRTGTAPVDPVASDAPSDGGETETTAPRARTTPNPGASSSASSASPMRARTVAFMAENILELLNESAPRHLWAEVLSAASQKVDERGD